MPDPSPATCSLPDANTQQMALVNKFLRNGKIVPIDPDQKWAICALYLNPAVTPADYPALKTAIEAVAGIQQIQLVVDGQAPATIPPNTESLLATESGIRIHDLPVEP